VDANALADYLALSPVFAPLSAAERTDLAARMRARRFGKNEVVFHKDDPAAHLYLIAAGTVKIGIEDESGQEVVIALIRGGDVFGELALFDQGERSATATALTETSVFTLASRDFMDVLGRNPGAMRQLLALLARRVRHSTGHIEDLVFLDLPGRVAKTLIDQDELLGGHGVVELTQEDIAHFVGATRVAVNRVLVDLEKRGVVQLGRGSIKISDLEALRHEVRR
jgi:CRP/FNR family transcriptional regulator, cyclic AMP receptor protein